MELYRIEVFVDSENKNYENWLKKLDFEFEGTMRDCEVKSEKYLNVDMYSTISRNK